MVFKITNYRKDFSLPNYLPVKKFLLNTIKLLFQIIKILYHKKSPVIYEEIWGFLILFLYFKLYV